MSQNDEISTTRHNLLLGGTALLGMTAVNSIAAAAGQGHNSHDHHHHSAPNKALVKAAFDCMMTSQACLVHCLGEFKKGDTEMADCAQTVQESATMRETLAEMASLESKHLKCCYFCLPGCLRVLRKSVR